MTILEAFVLGLIQGLAEFLPVSSSGHLVILQELMGIADPSVFFEVFLHFATALAIILFFKNRLLQLTIKEFGLLVVASIPAGLIGVFLGDKIVEVFSSIAMAAVMLIVTGFINLAIDRLIGGKQEEPPALDSRMEVSPLKAIKIGVFQMFALIPGISRSGSTVLGGLHQGLSRFSAFEFSFLMAIPVILGANVLEIVKLDMNTMSAFGSWPLLVGFVTAFATGFLSLRLLEYITKQARFEVFAYYCWVVGGGLLLLTIGGVI